MMQLEPAPGVTVRVASIIGPSRQNRALAARINTAGVIAAVTRAGRTPYPVTVTVLFGDGKQYPFQPKELDEI